MDEKRESGHLRKYIGAKSGLFCFIHTPDDALSMIREWGIILDDDKRSSLINQIFQKKSPENIELFAFRDRVYDSTVFHDIDYEKTKQRLKNCAYKQESSLQKTLLEMIDNEEKPWQGFVHIITHNNLPIASWDLIVFCGNRSAEILPIKPLIE